MSELSCGTRFIGRNETLDQIRNHNLLSAFRTQSLVHTPIMHNNLLHPPQECTHTVNSNSVPLGLSEHTDFWRRCGILGAAMREA